LTELHQVETMHMRKHGMMMNSDGIIALPGGTGTLEELLEAITWKRLGIISIPILIINIDGFYDPLVKLFDNMFQEHFMNIDKDKYWIIVNTVDEAIEQLLNILHK
jgi:uncharacterized protein (TIGR00730 family)